MTAVPTWVLWPSPSSRPLLTFGAATAGLVLTRRGVNAAIAESRVARELAAIADDASGAEPYAIGLMEYGKLAGTAAPDKPDLMMRGDGHDRLPQLVTSCDSASRG